MKFLILLFSLVLIAPTLATAEDAAPPGSNFVFEVFGGHGEDSGIVGGAVHYGDSAVKIVGEISYINAGNDVIGTVGLSYSHENSTRFTPFISGGPGMYNDGFGWSARSGVAIKLSNGLTVTLGYLAVSTDGFDDADHYGVVGIRF